MKLIMNLMILIVSVNLFNYFQSKNKELVQYEILHIASTPSNLFEIKEDVSILEKKWIDVMDKQQYKFYEYVKKSIENMNTEIFLGDFDIKDKDLIIDFVIKSDNCAILSVCEYYIEDNLLFIYYYDVDSFKKDIDFDDLIYELKKIEKYSCIDGVRILFYSLDNKNIKLKNVVNYYNENNIPHVVIEIRYKENSFIIDTTKCLVEKCD